MIRARVLRTGDGSHKYSKQAENDAENPLDNNNFDCTMDHLWGFGDKAMTETDMKNIVIHNRQVD
jgi:hypothetical protein